MPVITGGEDPSRHRGRVEPAVDPPMEVEAMLNTRSACALSRLPQWYPPPQEVIDGTPTA